MLTFIVILAGIVQLIVSTFVLLQDRRSLSNILFFLIGITSSAWALTNYLTLVFLDSPDLIFFVRSILLFAVIQNALFYMFARTFPSVKWKYSKKWLTVYLLFTVFAAIITVSPYVFSSVTIENGLPTTQAEPGIIVFAAHAALSITVAFVSLFKNARRSTGKNRLHLQILIAASFLNWIVVPITNFALTPLLKTTIFIVAGPIYTLFFASIIAYAMIAHKLFDVRAAISRSITYALALVTMIAIYAGLVFGATLIFLDPEDVHTEQLVVFTMLAVFLAFTYQPLKKFFDKFTGEVFYRQSYDSEKTLNEYSDYLVDEVDTEKIIDHTLAVLDASLNPESAYIMLYLEGAGAWYDSSGLEPGEDRDAVAKALEYQKPSIMASDLSNIREDEFTKNIKDHLSREGIRLSVKLSTHGQLEGFILLGDKKNGSRYSPDDHNFLTTIANELSVSLQNSERFDEIQRFNATLKEQIEAATEQLRESNKKLQSLDQAKDEFISMASHQLRTPLTSVKGYVSMMMDGDAGPITDEQRGLLGEAFASSQRMVYLISDLLNVSRLKTGKFLIERTKVDLPKIITQEVNQLTPAAQTRNLNLSFAPPTRFPEMMLDETKTRQVIMNFIDNAIYYTKSGGQIEVQLRVNNNQAEFRVKDSGIGVPARDQHKLFTKFFRARNARSARPDGTGLGLYMAQKIITAQNGTIHFESKEGKGSEFGFNLPLNDENSTQKSSK